ncbi:hypothetical protein MA786_003227 [Vibrio parahaemolyticus]|nr:hypothetical protein [Vibrio parahaemolyticus]EIV8640410.1 hypothetical protein [Vibrio parahaemolyticus]EIY6410622.1 hypothetical protein [Vibrio parahaemolyticus]EJB1764594.1 hypothetical protein [Vibrio parahaemolyticus]
MKDIISNRQDNVSIRLKAIKKHLEQIKQSKFSPNSFRALTEEVAKRMTLDGDKTVGSTLRRNEDYKSILEGYFNTGEISDNKSVVKKALQQVTIRNLEKKLSIANTENIALKGDKVDLENQVNELLLELDEERNSRARQLEAPKAKVFGQSDLSIKDREIEKLEKQIQDLTSAMSTITQELDSTNDVVVKLLEQLGYCTLRVDKGVVADDEVPDKPLISSDKCPSFFARFKEDKTFGGGL